MTSAVPTTNVSTALYAERAAGSYGQLKLESGSNIADSSGKASTSSATKLSGNAIYFSPTIKIDPDTHIVIYLERDANTGEVTRQYPTKEAVKAYQQTLKEKINNNPNFVKTVNSSQDKPVTDEAKKSPVTVDNSASNNNNFNQAETDGQANVLVATSTGSTSSVTASTTAAASVNIESTPVGTLTNQAIAPIGSNSDAFV